MAKRSKISWNAAQQQRLRKAVSSYNAAVTRMEKSGKYMAVPNRTTVEREMRLVETRDELRQRITELGRILVKNNPEAGQPVNIGSDEFPMIVPKYLKDEINLAVRSINERRKRYRMELFGDAADVSAAMEAQRVANKNLRDLNGEYYQDGDDLDDLWEELYPKTSLLADNYKDAWMEYNGDEFVVDVIDWMAANYPDELHMIFESGDDEVDINYIYPESKSSDMTPMVIRHNNIRRYWNDVWHTYHGDNHPGFTEE